VFDLRNVSAELFDQPVGPGLERWAPLLPPLVPGPTYGEGGTPLVQARALDDWIGRTGIFVKDESRNPTWSHKDRLNLCTVSGVVGVGAPGVAVASSGNQQPASHGGRRVGSRFESLPSSSPRFGVPFGVREWGDYRAIM
jgi:threonine synthase